MLITGDTEINSGFRFLTPYHAKSLMLQIKIFPHPLFLNWISIEFLPLRERRGNIRI